MPDQSGFARHDLVDFMISQTREMDSEYHRIRRRRDQKGSLTDSGTAGDQGDENWAKLLREWLPQDYHVTTKGRILTAQSRLSSQIDVFILKPEYPKRMLGQKYYLAAGIAAAFECKLTLKPHHIADAFKMSRWFRQTLQRSGSIYKELYNHILYGLLCHSHRWKSKESTPVGNIDRSMSMARQSGASTGDSRFAL